MKKFFFILFILLNPAFAQSGRIQIAFLGVFHMCESPDYKQESITDLLSTERQKQIQSVIDDLVKFRPDKIFVENTPDTQPY